ncbi:MAG: hypothetical protein MJA29_13375, partial [Candidatus Omnitrophica bacterium]|nr:hypothetical protein [Candidatus Omnitrophota bacterium]
PGMEFKDLDSGAKNSSSLSIFSGLTGAVLCCTGAVFQNQFLCLKTNFILFLQVYSMQRILLL